MQRRNFIRILGGGVVLGAGASLSGCADAPPAQAISGWAGPPADFDLRRWALAHALLAPNAHNRQPWLADLRQPDAIVLRVDRERLLPETDPAHRQILISQGTFLELLVLALAARGQVARVEAFPEGEFGPTSIDDRPVARLTWAPAPSGAPADPLFGQILKRHTTKVPYDPARRVAPQLLQTLLQAAGAEAPFGLRAGGLVEGPRLDALRSLTMAAAETEIRTERTVMESQRLIRIGPSEILRHRDGISITSPGARLLSAVGLFDRSTAPAPGSAAMNAMLDRYKGLCGTAMGWVWLSTDTASNTPAGRTRSAELAAGRAYARLHLKATELGLQMHPLSQALQEFDEMREHRERVHQLVVEAGPAQRTLQMLCRIGYAEGRPPSPRRALEGIIQA